MSYVRNENIELWPVAKHLMIGAMMSCVNGYRRWSRYKYGRFHRNSNSFVSSVKRQELFVMEFKLTSGLVVLLALFCTTEAAVYKSLPSENKG